MEEISGKSQEGKEGSSEVLLGRYLARILEALSEVIVPEGGELRISVKETRALWFLAKYLRELEPGARFGLKALLMIFDLLPFLFIFRFSRFVNLPREEQVRYLQDWNESGIYYRRMVVVLLKTLIGMGFYNDPKVLETIGFKLKCPQKRSAG